MYPDSIGGREKYVYHLADSLGKKGHEVKVFTCTASFHSKLRKHDNFTVYYLPSFDIPLKNARYRIPITMLPKLLFDDADVIHAQDIHHFTTFASAFIAKIRGVPFVVTEHGYPPLGGLMKILIKVYDKTLLKFIAKSSEKIIAVSSFIQQELKYRYKLNMRNAVTVHNGMYNIDIRANDADTFVRKYSLKGKKIILGLGRQTKEKGFQYLISAFKKMSKKFPDTVLVIIGPGGSYRIFLDGLVKLLDLQDRVIFTGRIEEELLKSAMRNCEMVVIPSEYDPFPFVALESLSYGKPVIAAEIGGIPEIITHEKNGLLFKPRDENDLAEKMELLLRDEKLKKAIIRNSRKSLERFNWKLFIEQIESVYEKAATATEAATTATTN